MTAKPPTEWNSTDIAQHFMNRERDMDDTPDLKRCPFCGGKPSIIWFAHECGIRCEDCKFEGVTYPHDVGQSEGYFDEIKMIEAASAKWNNRAHEARHKAELAAVLEEAALYVEALQTADDEYERWLHPDPAKIRALTPSDARAALDKLIAEAVQVEREACARIAGTEGVSPETNVYVCGADCLNHGMRIAAAIRNRGGEE